MKTDEQAEKKIDKETFPHVLASCCASLPQKTTNKRQLGRV